MKKRKKSKIKRQSVKIKKIFPKFSYVWPLGGMGGIVANPFTSNVSGDGESEGSSDGGGVGESFSFSLKEAKFSDFQRQNATSNDEISFSVNINNDQHDDDMFEPYDPDSEELDLVDFSDDDFKDDSRFSDVETDNNEPEDETGYEEEVMNDPDRQGEIRKVENAHLVYKRQTEDGTFDELWVYNIDKNDDHYLSTKKAILAGTDIPDDALVSSDKKQRYELITMGNAQLLKIYGLPN